MTPAAAAVPAAFPGTLASSTLSNGLEVHRLDNPAAPVVTAALTYRAGGGDDPPGRAGLAHFLEHMMFKGSRAWPAGEIDRTTRALGGSNNAFTGQDLTTYYFSFGRPVWHRALDIEADRMRGLVLDPVEVERERAVILEEIAMYEAEPWDALERAVRTAFYGDHPYARPITGTSEEVAAIEPADLEAFHRRYYRPDNAVLVVAGDLGNGVDEEIAARFAELPPGDARSSPLPSPPPLTACRRLRLERGRVGRMLCWLPVPPPDHDDFPAIRLLAAVLGTGRSSRLQSRLVERGGECAWLSVGLGETAAGGMLQIAAELVPGGSTAKVEEVLLTELAAVRSGGVDDAALERAKRLSTADWVFAHERIEEQAMTLAEVAALWSPGYATQQLHAMERLGGEELVRVAARYLDPDRGGVLGRAESRG